MFRTNRFRNSFLNKKCKEFARNAVNDQINRIFFCHLEASSKSQERQIIEASKEHFEDFQVGYGKVGLEILVKF